MPAPDPLSLVVDSVNQLRTDLNTRLTAQDVELKAIREQATKTNGRVTSLERKQIADDAARKAVEAERDRVSKENTERAEHTHRVKDSIETLAVVAAVPTTVFAALIASGRIF